MKRIFLLLIIFFSLAAAGQPYCRVRNFDEDQGLSQRLVKGIVQDNDGVIWAATWNGLNRFDGKDFTAIRPDISDPVFRYSSRIGELRLAPDGNLLCRIDENLVGFDVRSYRFTDLQSQIEQKLGRSFSLRAIMPTECGKVVLRCSDGRYLTLDGYSVEESDGRPDYRYVSTGNRKLGNVGPYRHDDLVLSRQDATGRIWLITRDGAIVTAKSDSGPFVTIEQLDVDPASVYYCTTDNRGNVWLRTSVGISCVSTGQLPFMMIIPSPESMVRTSLVDSDGRVWLSESDTKAVSVRDGGLGRVRYLTADGRLTESFTSLGHAVYSMCQTPDGTIWLGTKPDGLIRLQPDGDRFTVSRFRHNPDDPASLPGDNVYDMLPDAKGRLWIATLGNGIGYIPDYRAADPTFVGLLKADGYPAAAKAVRHLAIAGDTMLVAATTAGLLTLDIADGVRPPLRASLHVSVPSDCGSLGNIAVMDVAVTRDGQIVAATESDGLNIARAAAPDTTARWVFSHHNSDSELADVALSAVVDGDKILTVSSNKVFLYDHLSGKSSMFGQWLSGDGIRFSDGRPTHLGDGRWLVGHDKGAVVFRPDSVSPDREIPVMFTSASIENRPDTILAFGTESLILTPDERNLTLRFAALDYSGDEHRYAYRIDDSRWIPTGSDRSVTFLDLRPGVYTLTVRASSPSGQWAEGGATIKIEVVPSFSETGLAKALYFIGILIAIALIGWIIVYIRSIKRKQRETLDAYMKLLEQSSSTPDETSSADGENEPLQENIVTSLTDDERHLMDKVMDFVNGHLADAEVSVDDMAEAVGLSRSSLNRKLKSMTGLSPAEFMRESRLSHAAKLLVTTDLSIKEIAIDCGFSDLNYFGKCFKASRSVTPGAFRKSGGGV